MSHHEKCANKNMGKAAFTVAQAALEGKPTPSFVVEILHKDGLSTRYAHLNAFADGLEKGQTIGMGAEIGSVGQSGTATGPNLHFEVRHNGVAVDPLETAIVFLPPHETGSRVAQAD